MRAEKLLKIILMVTGAAFALLPERYLPGGQGLNAEGQFEGRPVEIQWTGQKAAPYSFALHLQKGRCDYAQLNSAGTVLQHGSVGEQLTRDGQVEPGGSFRFSPSPDVVGGYHVRIGRLKVLGPLLTLARVVVLAGCLLGIFAGLWGLRLPWAGQDRRRRLAAAAVLAVSSLVLYSLVHEAGHLLFGTLFGAQPDWHAVRWTVFSGEEPHAAFRHLPPGAEPWMSAGGILLPSLVGMMVLLLWTFLRRRTPWWVQLLAIIPGLVLLLGNLGLFADAGHTLALASHLGLGGVTAQIAARSPAIVTLVIFGFLCAKASSRTRGELFGLNSRAG